MAGDNPPLNHEILFYATPSGAVRVEVVFEEETFWLSQKKMAELFGVESHTITYHLKEIYNSGELKDLATTRKIRVVQPEGGRGVARGISLYNLDAIIAVGYRVNSREATRKNLDCRHWSAYGPSPTSADFQDALAVGMSRHHTRQLPRIN